MGKTHGDSITYNCEVCNKEKTVGLYAYNQNKHHFCSKECYDIFQNITYHCKDGCSRCNKCGEEKPISEFMVQKRPNGTPSYLVCKVCEYFRRKEVIIKDDWTIDEYRIILDNILNKRTKYIDDIVPLLNNKTFDELVNLLKTNLKIGGRSEINIRGFCANCGLEISLKLFQYKNTNLNFCTCTCNGQYYGKIKSENAPIYSRICPQCNKVFYVNTNRVNSGKDKYCSCECSQESQRLKFIGKNNPNWQGGISELYEFLRRSLLDWKNKSMEANNYKCLLSGGRFDDVHHLYSFESIVKETLNDLNFPIKQLIQEYTQNELEMMSAKCLEIHYKYPLGVCLKASIHKIFHINYGFGNNTPEQFDEFKQRFYAGEFDSIINII